MGLGQAMRVSVSARGKAGIVRVSAIGLKDVNQGPSMKPSGCRKTESTGSPGTLGVALTTDYWHPQYLAATHSKIHAFALLVAQDTLEF